MAGEAAGSRVKSLFVTMLRSGLEEDGKEVLVFCLRGAAATGAVSLEVFAVCCCLVFAEG